MRPWVGSSILKKKKNKKQNIGEIAQLVKQARGSEFNPQNLCKMIIVIVIVKGWLWWHVLIVPER